MQIILFSFSLYRENSDRKLFGQNIKNKIILPLVTLLKQGIEPSWLSLALASDSAIMAFPALGIATITCTVVAALYRLNLPAIQLAN